MLIISVNYTVGLETRALWTLNNYEIPLHTYAVLLANQHYSIEIEAWKIRFFCNVCSIELLCENQ